MRSAVMRYWLKDPGDDRQAPERVDKAIILWDAKRVEKSGKYCFRVVHFYRTYKYCCEERSTQVRDSWYEAIESSIKYS